jgi:hypothetical protein
VPLPDEPSSSRNAMDVAEEMQRAAFGPEYFRGIMWGSACSLTAVSLGGRRYYRILRKMQLERLNSQGKRDSFMTINPTYTTVVFGCCCTGLIKASKLVASYCRYTEFLWEEYLFENFATEEDRAVVNTMMAKKLEAEKKELGISAAQLNADPLQKLFTDNYQSKKKELIPGFWDGFAVGVMGSLQDAHNPIKPVDRYVHLQAGKGNWG